MDKPIATETNAQTIATEEGQKVIIPTEDDLEAKNIALEVEKHRLIEESANYKLAYLKEKSKRNKTDEDDAEEDVEDKMRRIANETLANSRIAEIAYEQDQIIKKALKENKELKLAQLNKPTSTSTSAGGHTESIPVKDTLVTQDQMTAFKAKGWTDKDIERYKKNLQKYGGR